MKLKISTTTGEFMGVFPAGLWRTSFHVMDGKMASYWDDVAFAIKVQNHTKTRSSPAKGGQFVSPISKQSGACVVYVKPELSLVSRKRQLYNILYADLFCANECAVMQRPGQFFNCSVAPFLSFPRVERSSPPLGFPAHPARRRLVTSVAGKRDRFEQMLRPCCAWLVKTYPPPRI